jgi:hypothetical protein
MLGAGSSLDEIGQVLRHQDALTTMIYAKVDVEALRELARTWPVSPPLFAGVVDDDHAVVAGRVGVLPRGVERDNAVAALGVDTDRVIRGDIAGGAADVHGPVEPPGPSVESA